MNESSPSEKAKTEMEKVPDLEFPINREFHPLPPKLSMTEYVEWCDRMRAGTTDDSAARAAAKCTVEFVL